MEMVEVEGTVVMEMVEEAEVVVHYKIIDYQSGN
jgi:hypothetical protein